jgi:uncharacterized protein (TIRG00374 family)
MVVGPVLSRRWKSGALAVLLLAGFMVVIASTDGSLLTRTASILRRLDWAWIPAALVVEWTSMASFARAHRRLLRGGGLELQIMSMVAVTYAGNAISVSLPVAGPEVGTAFAFKQYRRRGADAAAASWALAVSGLIASLTFALVIAGGAIASRSERTSALGLAGAAVTLVLLACVFLALRHRVALRLLNRIAARVASWLNRTWMRSGTEPIPALDSFFEQIASIKLPALYLAEVTLFLLWNWVGDCLCLGFAVRATGAAIPWHALFLAYGAIGAGVVTLTPGGVGVIEVALSGALVAAGLRGGNALAAVVVYRLISFWLVMAAGWVLVVVLSRSGKPAPAPVPEQRSAV